MARAAVWFAALLATVLIAGPLRVQSVADDAPDAGRVTFQTSCDEAVRADFDRAAALLHSFEYPESKKSFRAILGASPGCVMARWGIAMSLWHPLWAPPSRADLAAGSAVLEGAALAAPTEREAAYLSAIQAFYDGWETIPHAERAQAYSDRMEEVYLEHLDDPEAAVFYALSLLGAADPRDKSYANQFKAAGLLNWVRNGQPHHPGVLHYLIHSYDYPGLAHLALPAATIYADVAPASTHAQHMPSHIFTRLGLWERSIASNHDSTASAAHYTKHANLPGHYDEGLHSMDYLLYALLQTARDEDARRHLEKLRGIGKANAENFKVAYTYAAAPARYALERREWAEASAIALAPPDFPWEEFPWARAIVHFARGIGAARSEQLELARAELAVLQELRDSLDAATLPYWREEVFVQADAVQSWIALAEGESDTALRLARAAADREDAVDKHPVTPGEVVPARELLADLLLELDRPGEALAEYRAVLRSSPNRLNAVLGAGRAASRLGQDALARDYYARVLEQSARGSAERPSLREARAVIN
jgi:tetratricopeptide (TPR) repeat protein